VSNIDAQLHLQFDHKQWTQFMLNFSSNLLFEVKLRDDLEVDFLKGL
jgi:hypothetical protein